MARPTARSTNKFRVSAALKTIIGRELITDDFVAVFELVKNAFDAHARNVEIRFEGLGTGNSRLIIQDDGKGMTPQDISEKWLFVAYSAKREGTEDRPRGRARDYRNKIATERIFAGAKGIGRFSCDRLGRHLTLYSRAKPSGRYQRIDVDWQDFEVDSTQEFVDIKVKRSGPGKIAHPLKIGTILEMTSLREEWDRERIAALKSSLRKLINPNQENDARRFNVSINVPQELENDRVLPKEDHINGPVRNFLFEELGLKTTEIHCTIDSKGRTISTSLRDRGTLIYDVVEKNPFPTLKNVRIHLFALNKSAKILFKKIMGVHNVAYGSVFLYKNGFRVNPIGDDGDDGLGIDRRKQQGTSRYLGTRDLSGRIEISGDDKTFKEVSSRNAGFIDSPEWRALNQFFRDFALKRLERYTIDVIKWGNPTPGNEHEVLPGDVRMQILDVINKLTDSKDVIDIDYDPDLLDIIAERQSDSVSTALKNFKRIAEEQNNSKLLKDVNRAEKRLADLAKAKEEAEGEAQSERQARYLTQKQLDVERQKNVFLVATSADPNQQRLNLQHWIGIAAQEMGAQISDLMHGIKTDGIDKKGILKGVGKLQFWIDQIANVSKVVTKADFSLAYPSRRMDLARFIFEYLSSDIVPKAKGMRFEIDNRAEPFVVIMRPIEITILFDNLISNAMKAHAHSMMFSLGTKGKRLTVEVANDGEPVPASMTDSMFELGISGKGGSGIGLYTCREIVSGMGGDIAFKGNHSTFGGANFELSFYA